MWSRIIIILLISFLLLGCSNRFVIRKNRLNKDYSELIDYIKENDEGFNTYSIKYTGKYDSPKTNLRFRGLLRIVKGEKIWISISPFGIEAARILFTPEEVKFINRQNNTYFIGGYTYFEKKYDITVNYQLIEHILTNRFLLLPEKEQNIKKTEEGLFEIKLNKTGLRKETYLIHPGLKKLTRVVFDDLKRDAKFSIGFGNYIGVESASLPQAINLNIENKGQNIDVNLNYKKITVDKEFKVPFRIPSKYKQIWP